MVRNFEALALRRSSDLKPKGKHAPSAPARYSAADLVCVGSNIPLSGLISSIPFACDVFGHAVQCTVSVAIAEGAVDQRHQQHERSNE
jgi:hypothetical protein